MLRFNTDIGRLEVWRGDHWATILGESPNLNGGARGIFGGGNNPAVNIIEYITITSTGQNTQDFGDLSASKRRMGAVSSSTRGVFGGGAPTTNVIEFITISTLGNSSDFGDLFSGSYSLSKGNISNSIRGIFGIGHNTSGYNNIIEFITIATTGNATDFGDLTTALGCERASTSSTVRGVFAGGGPSAAGSSINIIDFVTIMSTGNAAPTDTEVYKKCLNSTSKTHKRERRRSTIHLWYYNIFFYCIP
jgi:hypothetical protein